MSPVPASTCLDDSTILALLGGAAPVAIRAASEAHLATCDACRELVSAMAKAASSIDTVPETAPPAFVPGEMFDGKYRIDRVLGEGGMGVVLVAHHGRLARDVAIKVLRPELGASPIAAGRFLREARAAAGLAHPNVARVLDAGTLPDGAPYQVLELLQGLDLERELARRGPLPWPEAVGYVRQACDGIGAAHEEGLVHRDLKPANLFLAEVGQGKSRVVKVLDFGIVKSTRRLPDEATLSHENALLGSPRFMAPEQFLAPGTEDARTDVWGLGGVLYELLTAESAFDGPTVAAVFANIAHGPTPLARAKRPDVPAGLESVLARCFSKDPADRFESAEALSDALAPFASEHASGASPTSPPTIPPSPSPPPPLSTAPPAAPALSAEEPPEATPKPARWPPIAGGAVLFAVVAALLISFASKRGADVAGGAAQLPPPNVSAAPPASSIGPPLAVDRTAVGDPSNATPSTPTSPTSPTSPPRTAGAAGARGRVAVGAPPPKSAVVPVVPSPPVAPVTAPPPPKTNLSRDDRPPLQTQD